VFVDEYNVSTTHLTKTKGRARAAYNAGFQACENQEEQEVALFCLASASVYLIHTWHVRVAFV